MKSDLRKLLLISMLSVLLLALPSAATDYNLYCGKTNLAGYVSVTGTGTAASPLLVTYHLNDPVYDSFLETHWTALLSSPLTNGAWRSNHYMNNAGNPTQGRFPKSDGQSLVLCPPASTSSCAGTKYVAAHGVAEFCDRKDLNLPSSLDMLLNCAYQSPEYPDRIDYYGDKSYVDVMFSDLSGGVINLGQWYDAWCGSTTLPIIACEMYNDVTFYPTVTADSVDPDYQCVNFLFNHREGSYGGETWTKDNWQEFQAALWIFQGYAGTFPLGDVDPDPDVLNAIVGYANANDCDSFVPACGDMIAVVVNPGEDLQPLIIPFPLPCKCYSETCWASDNGLVNGEPTIQFPGNNWASFITYPEP